jgi:hypothetical protein
MRYLALLATGLIAATTAFAQQKPAPHASRDAAIQLLRHEGILHGKTRMESAEWSDKTNSWLVILRHPSGIVSHWFVDANAQNYQGSTCTH